MERRSPLSSWRGRMKEQRKQYAPAILRRHSLEKPILKLCDDVGLELAAEAKVGARPWSKKHVRELLK